MNLTTPGAITAVICYLCLVAVMSGASLAAYGFDKRRAATAGRRISERTLHWLAFLGGWPGAWLGQRLFRHKTAKVSFLIVFWSIVVLHVGIVVAITYVLARSPG